MRFVFNDTVFTAEGKLDGFKEMAFADDLTDVFCASPEGTRHSEKWHDLSFHAALIHCAHRHLDKDLCALDAKDLEKILLETLPRYVGLDGDAGEEIVEELRALWMFLGRQYGAPQAPAMIQVLDDPQLAERIDVALNDPALVSVVPTLYLHSHSHYESWMDEDELVIEPSLDHPGTFVRDGVKIGRNAPCPCGSGKKYKKCCLH